jgi:hypothetical protein
MSVSNGEGTPCALMATAGKQPSSSTSHRWPLIVLIDDVAQIVERGEFPMQVSGVIVVGDCCISFEAEAAEINLVTIEPDGSLPASIMDFADPFVS